MEGLLELCDVPIEDVLTFMVSDNEAGYLIGKYGNRISTTRKRFDVEISVNKFSPRIVSISGVNKVNAYGYILVSLVNCR